MDGVFETCHLAGYEKTNPMQEPLWTLPLSLAAAIPCKFCIYPESSRINHNRKGGNLGGRATKGWPRRGETSGSERIKGHRG
jgi:hypothetical protein